jgi:hypothetical protein
MLVRGNNTSWTHERSKNCYDGHGAKEIDAKSVGVMSLASCEAKCLEEADCTGITMEVGGVTGNCWRRKNIKIGSCDTDSDFDTWLKEATPTGTINLMTKGMLGDFEGDPAWEGYACDFSDWTACVNSTVSCSDPVSTCHKCTSKRSGNNEPITCVKVGNQTQFHFPPGGIFPVVSDSLKPLAPGGLAPSNTSA